MRSKSVVYVDAGYLFASAATRLTGTSLRNGIIAHYEKLVPQLISESERISGLPVLRVNWYDAAPKGQPTPEQEFIGRQQNVKLRLGHVNFEGQQKGVDLRIGLDMVRHARSAAVDVIVLVSGDSDLTEAVEQAQLYGVEVILLAVPNDRNEPHGISRRLRLEADRLEVIDVGGLDSSIVKRIMPIESSSVSPFDVTDPSSTVKVAPVPNNADDAAAEGDSSSEASPDDATSDAEGTQRAVPTPSELAKQVRVGARRPGVRRTPSEPHPSPSQMPVTPLLSARRNPNSVNVYTSTDGYSSFASNEEPAVQEASPKIQEVVERVLRSYWASASPGERGALEDNRPSVPHELDRAMLLDLSEALDTAELSDPLRFALRKTFWEVYDSER